MSTASERVRMPSIRDVARLAGVSHQTVSRVLNDMPNVRPATRARVEQAIAQLRYSPSPAARALVTRRTSTLALRIARSPRTAAASSSPSSPRCRRNAGDTRAFCRAVPATSRHWSSTGWEAPATDGSANAFPCAHAAGLPLPPDPAGPGAGLTPGAYWHRSRLPSSMHREHGSRRSQRTLRL